MYRAAFEMLHPAVPATYFAGTIVLAMCGIEPRLVVISLVGALAFSAVTYGVAAAFDKLRWQVPLLLLICVINPLYSANGVTLLAKVWRFYIYAESVAYGAVMGALLVAVLAWIEGAAHVIGQDELMVLGHGALPTASLALSMTLRLVPQLLRRSTSVRTSLTATTAAAASGGPDNGDGPGRARVRVLGSLVSWALEDSLERSDSMRARGWGSGRRRTTFRPHRFRRRDAVALAVVAALLLASAFAVWVAVSSWRFYPTMRGSAPLAAYVCYAALCLAPTAYVLFEDARWGR